MPGGAGEHAAKAARQVKLGGDRCTFACRATANNQCAPNHRQRRPHSPRVQEDASLLSPGLPYTPAQRAAAAASQTALPTPGLGAGMGGAATPAVLSTAHGARDSAGPVAQEVPAVGAGHDEAESVPSMVSGGRSGGSGAEAPPAAEDEPHPSAHPRRSVFTLPSLAQSSQATSTGSAEAGDQAESRMGGAAPRVTVFTAARAGDAVGDKGEREAGDGRGPAQSLRGSAWPAGPSRGRAASARSLRSHSVDASDSGEVDAAEAGVGRGRALRSHALGASRDVSKATGLRSRSTDGSGRGGGAGGRRGRRVRGGAQGGWGRRSAGVGQAPRGAGTRGRAAQGRPRPPRPHPGSPPRPAPRLAPRMRVPPPLARRQPRRLRPRGEGGATRRTRRQQRGRGRGRMGRLGLTGHVSGKGMQCAFGNSGTAILTQQSSALRRSTVALCPSPQVPVAAFSALACR